MTQRRKRQKRPGKQVPSRARIVRAVTWTSAAVCVATIAVVTAFRLAPARPRFETHEHPPSLHAGQVVPFGAGGTHYHVEFVIEKTGVVRLYPLDESAARPMSAEARPLLFTAQRLPDGETHTVMLRPAPEAGDAAGTTSRFVGRLPAGAIHGRLNVRFAEFKVRGERFQFNFDWTSADDVAAFREAYEHEQGRIFLSPAGKYSEEDVRTNGGRPPAARFAAKIPVHDHTPKPGDRVCPVSAFKAEPAFSWRIGGKGYWFCCQPCIDEFVLTAKERPSEVRPPEQYVRP